MLVNGPNFVKRASPTTLPFDIFPTPPLLAPDEALATLPKPLAYARGSEQCALQAKCLLSHDR
jgi:hypothetical protein